MTAGLDEIFACDGQATDFVLRFAAIFYSDFGFFWLRSMFLRLHSFNVSRRAQISKRFKRVHINFYKKLKNIHNGETIQIKNRSYLTKSHFKSSFDKEKSSSKRFSSRAQATNSVLLKTIANNFTNRPTIICMLCIYAFYD